jgi:hypothetical protein
MEALGNAIKHSGSGSNSEDDKMRLPPIPKQWLSSFCFELPRIAHTKKALRLGSAPSYSPVVVGDIAFGED